MARWLRAPLLLVLIVMAAAFILPVRAGANEVTIWNGELLTIFTQTSGNLVMGPPEVARDMAIVGNAMMDAVNAATGATLPFYAYSGGAVANADAAVAAATAAYTALSSVFMNSAWQTPISQITGTGSNNSNVVLANTLVLPELKTFLATRLGAAGLTDPASCSGSSSILCNGYNLGIAAGNAVTAARANDGAVEAIQAGLLTYVPPGSGSTPGVYVPPAARPAMYPTWGTVTPFSVSAAQMAAAVATVSGPPPLNSPAYAAALLETECVGSKQAIASLPAGVQSACAAAGFAQRTTRQAEAGLFWNDPGTTYQPPGHWLQIADTVLDDQGRTLLQSAQISALLGDAEMDAGIAAWTIKYQENLWRPITAINNCGSSGGGVTWTNPGCAPGWGSLINTPPHPDYIAGHPAFSQAGAVVLANFFGTDQIGFTSTSQYYCNGGTTNFGVDGLVASCTLNGTTYSVSNPADCAAFSDGVIVNGSPLICPISETFDSFSAASLGPDGALGSRVYGGIHTPFAVVDASIVGNAIGEAVSLNAGLPERVPEPSTIVALIVPFVALYTARLQSWPPRRRRTALGD